MSLDKYREKRDFNKTPEPIAEIFDKQSERFVIQRHRASHLHYDLRLEIEGVLKSWAIPKGPSMNPRDKRLAINTEDHPIKYLTFHGTIPKGNYGAGKMTIWDTGKYNIVPQTENDTHIKQYEKGDIKITFSGEKLQGNFALVKTNRGEAKNQWLLIKKEDEFATELFYNSEDFVSTPESSTNENIGKQLKITSVVSPMLATDADKVFNDANYIYELKWDGYRMLSNIDSGKAQLYSRNGISFDSKFSKIAEELETIEHSCILDGEVVVVDGNGVADFQSLQHLDSSKGRLLYYVFDLLYLNGHDTTSLTLLERKSLLPEILNGLNSVKFCDHIEGMGLALYQKAIDAGMEGIIAKEKTSIYTQNYRTTQWLKMKETKTDEAIICGYTDSKGALFGSLILGNYIDGNLQYVGNCGSGFSSETQKELLLKFKELEIEKCPFQENINLKGRKPNWVNPELVCEIKYSEITKSGKFRHPVFKTLRFDKTFSNNRSKKNVAGKSNSKTASIIDVDGLSVPISNLDKVFFPSSGITKYDLIDYYIKISDTILPYLKDRPQNLHRHPNGINGKSFYQKDNESLPMWAEKYSIYSKSSNREIDYLLCQNEASLLYMANLGCIEVNPWHSTISNLENPTYSVIDLDPSEKNTFEEVIEVALVTKEVLNLAKIDGYVKTSGKRGLHIYLPLANNYSYEEARDFTKLLCFYIHEKLPKLTSMERAIKNRKGKIYLDYLQNRNGQTIAAPYCVRPFPNATVSTPIYWNELKTDLKVQNFTIENVLERVEKIEDIFKAVLTEAINIEDVINNLKST